MAALCLVKTPEAVPLERGTDRSLSSPRWCTIHLTSVSAPDFINSVLVTTVVPSPCSWEEVTGGPSVMFSPTTLHVILAEGLDWVLQLASMAPDGSVTYLTSGFGKTGKDTMISFNESSKKLFQLKPYWQELWLSQYHCGNSSTSLFSSSFPPFDNYVSMCSNINRRVWSRSL